MKTLLSIGMFLLVLLVVCTARAQEPEPSLGDVARQSRAEKKGEAIREVSDQKDTEPLATEAPDTSLCGPPIPLMQTMYAAALLGQPTPPEDQLAKELLGWLDKHLNLEKMDPEELA